METLPSGKPNPFAEETDIKAPDYTDLEKAFRKRLIQEMSSAKDQRDETYPELDDMDYVTYWYTNAKAANAYIPPKIDEEDVRTTSGTTLEKKNTILSALLNQNLEPDIEAFDKYDEQVQELGTIMEDMVKKSREIEDYEEKRVPIYNELVSQGDVTVEDRYDEFSFPSKEVTSELDFRKLDKVKWKKRIDRIQKECSAQLLCGLNVYWGNVREPNIKKQPYVGVRRVYTRREAESIYGEWERWKNVPLQLTDTIGGDTDSVAYNDWTLEAFQDGMVEELRYFNKWTNDFMLMINGVMMFPVKEDGTIPLTVLNGDCEYPLGHGILEPIPNLIWGKSIPSKSKVDQAIFDEMLKAIVLKTRKSYNPPLANMTGQTISKRVLWAGHIEDDIDAEKLQPILENVGVTSSEFNAIQFIKSIIDQKSVSPIMEGQNQAGSQTAREIVEQKQQSMMKMGLSILGVLMLEKQLTKLRIRNIIQNWTEPMEKDLDAKKSAIYRTVTVDTSFEDGSEGKRIIDITEDIPDDSQVYAEEELIKMTTGRNVRKNYLNPKLLKAMDFYWFINIVPVEKSSNALRTAQFEESVLKAIQIFAPLGKMPNLDYVGTKWAINMNEDPAKFWQKQQPAMPQGMPQQGMQQGMPQQMPNQMGNSQPKQLPRPSVNTLASA